MSDWQIVPRADRSAVWLLIPSGVALTKTQLQELIRDLTEAHRRLSNGKSDTGSPAR